MRGSNRQCATPIGAFVLIGLTIVGMGSGLILSQVSSTNDLLRRSLPIQDQSPAHPVYVYVDRQRVQILSATVESGSGISIAGR